MQNLAQLTEQIHQEYSNLHSYVVLSENISLTEAGYLNTGKNEFLVRLDGLDELAEKSDIPKKFLRRLPPDIRALLFINCRKPSAESYKTLIARTGCKPNEILFIDDKESNIEAARNCGIEGIVFEGQKESERALINRLETFGIAVSE
jgi:hypothetical protein